MAKFGKTIIPFEYRPEPHELDTAKFFNKLGKDVEFLSPVYSKGVKTPDIKMDGILWEMKAPINKGKHTIQHAFRKALHQSKNIIFDLRRSKMSNSKSVLELKQRFEVVKICKRLLIITKDGKLLDLNR
jgi:hypothetical protein